MTAGSDTPVSRTRWRKAPAMSPTGLASTSAVWPWRDRRTSNSTGEPVVDARAPDDIVTGATPQLEPDAYLEPAGVVAPEAAALAGLYAERVAGAPAPPPGDLRFAWAGSLEAGKPHYYRLQAPRFLVEYDNRQDGANHVHTVLRDPAGDFGADLLARHYEEHH